MSLKSNFISILTAAALTVVFSAVGFGQDKDKTTTTTPATPEKVEKQFPGKDGPRKFGKFGREGFGGRHGGPGKMGGRAMGLMRGIQLTDAQREQIRGIREANKPNRANMEEVRGLIKAKHDGTITADQQARLDSLKNQARDKGKAVHDQIENVLTAEQKAQIEKRKGEMKERMEQFRNQRQQRRPDRKPDAPAVIKPKTI